MKTSWKNHVLRAIIAVAMTHTASAVHTEPLPGVSAQSDAYWANRATTELAAATRAESPVFYTGKPYDADARTYGFLYRSFDPELSRWTSADPSGFPDGANGQSYGFAPTGGFDSLGLRWYFVGENSNDSYSGSGEVPTDIDLTNSGSYSITGFDSLGRATSLQLTIGVSTTADGWLADPHASRSTTITLNINSQSGEVTMSGLTKDDDTDSALSVGKVNAAYNLGIEDGTNTVQGQIAYGHAYESSTGTISVSFAGAGLEVGVEYNLGVNWSRFPTLSFGLNKQNIE